MLKSKILRLLIIALISTSILTPSVVQADGLHFGIIKAIEKKVDELKEKVEKKREEEKKNEPYIAVEKRTAFVNLPGLAPETLKTVSIVESTVDSSGYSTVEVPRDFYSFVYAIDENGNIVGMYYGNASTTPINIDIDSTCKGVVMRIPIDWGKYDLLISDVLTRIENSSLYPALRNQVENIINTDPHNLISEQHPETWETAIQIISNIIQSATVTPTALNRDITTSSLAFLDPAYIEDTSGPQVLVKNKRSVPYGISSMNLYTGEYECYFGMSKRPWWVPGMSWVDKLWDWLPITDHAMDVKYDLGAGRFVTCLAKFPFSTTPIGALIDAIDAAVSGNSGVASAGDLFNYILSSQLSPIEKVKVDATIKGSVAWILKGSLIAVGFIPGNGDVVKIGGEIAVDLANTRELDLLQIPKGIFTSKLVWDKIYEMFKFIADTGEEANSYARVLAKAVFGDAEKIPGIITSAKVLKIWAKFFGTIVVIGDIADATFFIADTELAKDIALYEVSQDSSGVATIIDYTDNQSPIISSLIANPTSVSAGSTSIITCTASDPDGDTLSYTWTKTGGTINGAGSQVTWTAPSTEGEYTITCTVSNGKGGTAQKSVNVTVTAGPNNPPNTPNTPSGPSSGQTGVSYTFSTSATDPDGNRVQYYFDWDDGQTSDWTSLVNSGVSASNSHSYSNAGTYYIKAQAKDEKGATSGWSGSYSIMITSSTLTFTDLQPPTITTSESTYVAILSATGANFNNVNQITFSWSGPDSGSKIWDKGDSNWNAGVTVNSDTSMTLKPTVLYNVSGNQAKTWNWTATVKDNTGATKSRLFTVTYNPSTPLSFTDLQPPTITTSESTYVAILSATGANFNNVNQITFSWSGPDSGSKIWDKGGTDWNAGVTVNSDTSMTLKPTVLSNVSGSQKTWNWTVTLRDTTGATKSRQFTVTYKK